MRRATVDHFIPLEMNGPHASFNLVAACDSCNSRKHAQHPFVWLARKGYSLERVLEMNPHLDIERAWYLSRHTTAKS